MTAHVGYTDTLSKGHVDQFELGTLVEVQDNMERTWEVIPTSARFVEDIKRLIPGLQVVWSTRVQLYQSLTSVLAVGRPRAA